MPVELREASRDARLKCGNRRDLGTDRTSTIVFILADRRARKRPTNDDLSAQQSRLKKPFGIPMIL